MVNPDSDNLPPPLAQKLLTRFLRNDLAEEVLGDLDERFYATVKEKSAVRARLNYWYETINYLRPFALRKSRHAYLNNYEMIQTYFKIGWRAMLRQKMYSFIKIGGFALGIAACLLISLFIADELQYDQHYTDANRIYRLVGVSNQNGEIHKSIHFPAPMAVALKEDYPEVEMTGRYNNSELFGAGNKEVRPGTQTDNSYDQGFTYFDQELINILQLPFVYGNPQRALSAPRSMVITKRKADKYFPNENPIGKTLIVDNDDANPYVIGGVIEDFKSTSHFQFDFLITTSGLEFWKDEQKDWGASNYPIYLKLTDGVDPIAFQKKATKGILDKYVLPMLIKDGMSMESAQKALANAYLELQPLTAVHLYSTGIQDGLVHGDIKLVWLFGGISIFILLIAAINFINLSTAKSANRAKEVGLRKVVGSNRGSLVTQFLTESILFSLFSFVLGVCLAWLLLTYFNDLSGKQLSLPWNTWWMFPVLTVTAIVIGVLAGLYPSFYLSSFKPIQVLKGQLAKGSKGASLRSSLVIFQFTTSIVLIVGTVIIYQQMNFVLNKKIGFDKEQVLLIEGAGTLNNQVTSFKNELKNLPQVKTISVSDYLPITGTKRNGNSFWHEGKVQTEKAVIAQKWKVDGDYIKTMGMKVIEGRDFNDAMSTDSASAIVNQAMVREMGGEDLIGKRISNGGETFTVIGVVQDFHFESMRNRIEPMCLVLGNSPSIISVKTSSTDMASLIESVSTIWKKFAPHQPVRFAFLDERYAAMYADVQRMGKIFTTFAILAIVVACLGLFALSAFMIEQRSKEIGIRLVLGASLPNVFRLLVSNFMVLVVISIVLATPIAWYLMKKWLEDFTYRTEISWQVFALAGVIAMAIALFTISYQSIKAALANPVTSLRSE